MNVKRAVDYDVGNCRLDLIGNLYKISCSIYKLRRYAKCVLNRSLELLRWGKQAATIFSS